MHYDASYELSCFYPCSVPAYRPRLFGHTVPVMIIQYLGALKAWLYLPILKYLEVTTVVLRLPFLFIGAASVWLFYVILDRVAGRAAAFAGAVLLVTDASFLIATSYDFGPVALLHLSLLGGAFLLLRFEKTLQSRYLAAAFLIFGLALWHKALFVWMLGGLAAGSAAAFPRRVLALVTPGRAGIAALAICAGGSPLIYYNVVTRGATLHPDKVMADAAPMSQKLLMFRKTIDGSVPFGWVTEDAQPETALVPARLAGRLSVKLADAVPTMRANWMLYAFLGSCCLVPWLCFTRSRGPALFAIGYLAAAWGLMVAMPTTGASMHHVILLWPFPHFLIAVAGAEAAGRLGKHGARVMAGALAVLVAGNVLVVNRLFADLVTRGTTAVWTDAVTPLFHYLDALPGRRIVPVDWGYSTTLCLLSDGEMPLNDISFALLQPTPKEAAFIQSLVTQSDAVFVDHVAGAAIFPGVRERLDEIARREGYTREVVDVIADRNGRPRFEISRYHAIGKP